MPADLNVNGLAAAQLELDVCDAVPKDKFGSFLAPFVGAAK